MTVIAWDGRILAADKRSTHYNWGRTVTKIFRLMNNQGLVGFSGDAAHAMELLNWFNTGMDKATYPSRTGDNSAGTVHITPEGKIHVYNGTNAYHEVIEQKTFASGCGRDFALAAMHCGQNAVDAVVTTCHFDINCGNGVDFLEL